MRSAYPRIGLFIVLFASAAAAVDRGPTSKASATAWIPPVTPYGTPDLGGVWVNNRATPLERPKALEGRPFLTDAEVIAFQQRADRLFKNGNSDFAAGDAVFLAAFANLDTYKNPDATADSLLSDDREFDNRTSLIVDPPDGRIPPLTAAAQQRLAAIAVARAAARQRGQMRPGDLSNALRCITWGVPRLIVNPYTDHYRIIQSPGYVVLDLETDLRIIPMDGRPHLRQSIRHLLGDSRGRWEGNDVGHRYDELLSQKQFHGRLGTLASCRTLDTNLTRRDHLRRHHRRPDDVDSFLDRGDSLEEDEGIAVPSTPATREITKSCAACWQQLASSTNARVK